MRIRPTAFLPVIAGILAVIGSDRAAAEVRYQVTPLGPLNPVDINEQGQIAGFVGAQAEGRRAAVWLPATAYGMQAGLNELPSPQFPTGTVGAAANGINDHGQIVSTLNGPGSNPRAALWLPSAAYGRAAGWSVWDEAPQPSTVNSINNGGQVVGRAPGSFLWLPAPAYGMPAGIHFHGGYVASDVNESGQVSGSAVAPASTPYIYFPTPAFGRAAGVHLIQVNRPGPPGMFEAFGQAINDRGQVVGTWSHSDQFGNTLSGGFLWLPEDDAAHGRPAGSIGLPFGPTDINNTGFAVGGASLWDPATGQVTNLNDLIDPASGLEIVDATAMNDAGQIVGRGRIKGIDQGFLLTVPEPAALSLLAVAAFAALRRRRE